MLLADRVTVSRRFQRATRVDTDLRDLSSLEGFVCPDSSARVLTTMAHHIVESAQGAFTWTGPYGSGKSSLAVVLSALLNGDTEMRAEAASAVGPDVDDVICTALPRQSKGWRVLPVVGRRGQPEQLIGEALNAARFIRNGNDWRWSQQQALDALQNVASRDPRSRGGLLVIIDEMGKILEGAARDGADIYFLQQLAEMASRSNRRLIVIGILHQAFEEYAYRLSRETRDEWAKIQGRFVDLTVNAAPDEQIALLGRAIDSDRGSVEPGSLARRVAELNVSASYGLPRLLEDCWPLHPVVASLLGPISRRRFGQNQRSIFGFLNSAEPRGFQDFLRRGQDDELYAPDLLWDYLSLNLESSIMASPDGHRWALAVESLERCQALGGAATHIKLLKAIALVDLFKERSGLSSNAEILKLSQAPLERGDFEAALNDLQDWSLVVYRKFNDSYSVFEGSDFDLDAAVANALETMADVDFSKLNAIAGLQPIVAKRHYHLTGAMRWFATALIPVTAVGEVVEEGFTTNDAMGTFALAARTHGESVEEAARLAQQAVDGSCDHDLVVGLSQESDNFTALVRELLATEQVRDESVELQGDRVARREVEARVAALQGYTASEIERALDTATWYAKDRTPQKLAPAAVNGLASDLADARFRSAPRIHNELLNRVKPSSNAVAARNALLRRMAQQEGEQRLGIVGYPAEGGLLDSVLASSGLYRWSNKQWRFMDPRQPNDRCGLRPAWQAATDVLQSNREQTLSVSAIYDIWRKPPYGIKEGLLPVLAAAFILSKRRKVAFYRQNIFQARITDLDMDYLANDPRDIQLRWMDLSSDSLNLLSMMADVVRTLDPDNGLSDLEPIDVAKGLVAIHDRLPTWVGRTQRLSANGKRVRHLFKQANDPNGLIFDDIPQSLSDDMGLSQEETLQRISDHVRNGLSELQQCYPAMLHRLRETLLAELQVPNASAPMLAELRTRAENVRDLGGDHRLEAFIIRLSQFDGADTDMESLASMATNKPARNWVDSDIDRATVELADMAQRFMRIEALAHVKGRANMRHALAVTVGMAGRPATIHDEFDITELERSEVDALILGIQGALRSNGEDRRNVILAALAEVSAGYIEMEHEQAVS